MSATYILETRGLTKSFSGFTAVLDVDLRVRHGDIHALIGPNGAGKTTCFNLLTRFLDPTAGTIRFDGRDITRTGPADVAEMGMIRSFQISATFPTMTALQNVRVALQRAATNSLCFWRSSRRLSSLDERALDILGDVNLADAADTLASDLDYGRKRALEIATTLATDPRLMLLDEPTAGLGHEEVHNITSLIKKVSAGRTILMVEHNMSIVSSICDRVSVLQRGELLSEGTYDELSSDPRVIEAYLGAPAPEGQD